MKLKSIFDFEVNKPKVIRLTVPTISEYKEQYKWLSRCNKDFFQARLLPILKMITSGRLELEYLNPDCDQSWFKTLQSALAKSASTMPKDDFVSLYILLTCSTENSLEVIKAIVTPTEESILKEMVVSGPVTLASAAEKLALNDIDYNALSLWMLDNYYYSNWSVCKDNTVLKMFALFTQGTAPSSNRSWHTPGTCFIVPGATIVAYVLNPAYPAPLQPDTVKPDESFEENYIYFNGQDIIQAVPAISLLINTGLVKSGKTKIGISAGRKISEAASLHPLPPGTLYQNRDRAQILAILSVLAKGAFMQNEQGTDTQKWLRAIHDMLTRFPEELLNFLLENSVRSLPKEYKLYAVRSLSMLVKGIEEVLLNCFKKHPGEWIEAKSFAKAVRLYLAGYGISAIYPIDEAEGTEKVKDLSGDPLPLNEFKWRIQDIIFSGLLASMDAIGETESLYDTKGALKYLRLTPLGEWMVRATDIFPEQTMGTLPPEEVFECDDNTLIVYVKDPEIPSLSILRDASEKISQVRYALDGQKIAHGCATMDDLAEKIDRLRRYVLPNPGKRIEQLFTDLLAKCNLVTRTVGGSGYTLYDIGPNNKELLGLLTSDSEIKQFTLRVEGCRLLVKNSFRSKFFDKLRQAGFINDID